MNDNPAGNFLQYGVSYNLTSNIFITKILGRLDVLFQSGKFSLRQSRGLQYHLVRQPHRSEGPAARS